MLTTRTKERYSDYRGYKRFKKRVKKDCIKELGSTQTREKNRRTILSYDHMDASYKGFSISAIPATNTITKPKNPYYYHLKHKVLIKVG